MLVKIDEPFELFDGAFREFLGNGGTQFRYLISRHQYLDALKKLFGSKHIQAAYLHLKNYGSLPLKPPFPVNLTRGSYRNLLLLLKWSGVIWFDQNNPFIMLDGTGRISRKLARQKISQYSGSVEDLIYSLSNIYSCHPAITSLTCHLCIVGDINRLKNTDQEPKFEQLLGGYRFENRYEMFLRQIPITHLYIGGQSFNGLKDL